MDTDKKEKVRKQNVERQRRLRLKRIEAGYPRREFNLSDNEYRAVVAFITELRAKGSD